MSDFTGRTTVIADRTVEPITSESEGQIFRLEAGNMARTALEPLLTIDDFCVTFQNFGIASSTRETATIVVEDDQATIDNEAGAEITADGTAIRVDGRQASISNDGLIDGGRNGVDFSNGGESSGALFNFGTVSSDSRAVNIGGEGVNIYNVGQIVGTGDQRNGAIYSDGSANRYKIVNYGNATIDAGEDNLGAAISLQTGQDQGDVAKARIYNYGTIQGRGDAEDSSALAGDGIRIFSGAEDGGTTFRGNIVNYGSIFSSQEASGETAAIRIADGVGFDGRIINGSSGVIEGAANAIYFGSGAHDTRLINYGIIRSGDDAIELDEVAAFTGSITNHGTITGESDGDETGLAIRADNVTVGVTIVNTGTINGDVLLGSGNDTFDGATGSLNGFIIGGDGDDRIWSGQLDDFVIGDVIQRESMDIFDEIGDVIGLISDLPGHDSLYGGAGDDTITGDYFEVPEVGGTAFVGNDLIDGGEGNDRIAGDVLTFDESRLVGVFDDEFEGRRLGLDTIYGGEGDDVISGDIFGSVTGGDGEPGQAPGVDEVGNPIDGEAGRDGFDGPRPEVDTIFGGAGDDVIYGDASEDKRAGRDGEDVAPVVDPDPDDDAFLGFNGSPGQDGLPQIGGDSLFGGEGNDVLYGDVGRNILDGSSLGRDLLDGGSGDDTLIGDAGEGIFDGSAGLEDLLYGGEGNDLIIGDAGSIIDETSRGGDDTIEGGEGDDRIYGDAFENDNGNGGDDSIDGGAGQDTAFGGSGDDRIDGAEDGDQIYGGLGNDSLFGDAVEDFLGARGGNDQLFGGDGDDFIVGDAGRSIDEGAEGGDDTIEGGAGADTIFGDVGESLFDNASGGSDTLYGGDGNDILVGDVGKIIGLDSEGGDDTIFGGEGDDFIFGDAFNETDGLGGNDSLDGGAGRDTIFGESGNDRIDGGEGGDRIDGGEGDDRFVYRAGEGGRTMELVDVITGFEDGTDLIELVDGLEFGIRAGQAHFVDGSTVDGLRTDSDDSVLVITDGAGTITEALAVIEFVSVENLDATDILVSP